MADHEQFVTSCHSSINVSCTTLSHSSHKYSIVTNNMLVADTTSYAEAETCDYKYTACETLHQQWSTTV